jgi:hypothetical protein
VEAAARLVVARYAALGVLDRTGSNLPRKADLNAPRQREPTTISSASCLVSDIGEPLRRNADNGATFCAGDDESRTKPR